MGESSIMKKLSVILPSYNTPNLLENLLEIIKEVSNITKDYEIILVDDGSDDFLYVTRNNYVRVITHSINRGKGEALISGFKAAQGEIVCFIDADLQIPATFLKPYYEIMMGSRNPDILIGSKRHSDSKVDYPFIRRLYSFGFQTINKYLFGLKVLDTQSGLKFFRKDVIKEILPKLKVKGFAIDLEILVLAQRKGYKILEGPIEIKESFNSTVRIKAILYMFRDIINIWVRGKFKR